MAIDAGAFRAKRRNEPPAFQILPDEYEAFQANAKSIRGRIDGHERSIETQSPIHVEPHTVVVGPILPAIEVHFGGDERKSGEILR
jgi:hypothetical protein